MTDNVISLPLSHPAFAVFPTAPTSRRIATRSRCASRTFPPRAVLEHGGDAARMPAQKAAPGKVAQAIEPDAASFSESDTFSWTEQWYAVTHEADILDATPFPCTLFDTDLVLFRESAGRYSALLDRCCHRLAPLSEGRIVQKGDGCVEIECAYHGWQFNASGACTKIPQNPSGASIPRAAEVRAFPVIAERGLVFVWFGDPANADAASIPLPAHVRAYADSECKVTRNFSAIVPYSYETLVENIADPAHVQFAHHGVSPYMNRGVPSGGNYKFEMSMRNLPGDVISVSWGSLQVEYFPPAFLSYSGNIPSIQKFDALFHVSPVGRRRARLMLTGFIGRATPLKLFLISMLPRWMAHLETLGVLDGDILLLHGVERALGEPRNWKPKYGPPAGEADGAILRFRKWMDLHRDSMPWVGADTEMPAGETKSRRELTERLKYHTERCTACSGALRGWERTKKVASFLKAVVMMAVVSAGMLAVLVSAGILPRTAWGVLARSSAALFGLVLCFVQVERLCSRYIELLTYTGNSRKLYLTVKDRDA